jgi:hypothetical protein
MHLHTGSHVTIARATCCAGDAAANDTVGGRGQHKGPSGVTKAMLARYDGMGKQEKKSKLAALKFVSPVLTHHHPLRLARERGAL